jgi:MFS family permease
LSWQIDICGLELLKDVRFMLLFACMAIEDGTAVMFSNGLSSMRGAAHSENPGLPEVSSLLILFAIGSCIGRAVWGFVADKFYEHRAVVLLCTMVGMFFSNLLMTLYPAELVVGTLFVSFCFGGMFAIAPVICAEQFGGRHFGTNWGCVVFAPAIGSVSFSSLFGQQYEGNTAIGCENCEGTQCYHETFMITTAFLAVGVLLNIVLVTKVKDAAVGVKVGGLIPIIAPKPPPIFTQENVEQKLFQFE